MWENILSEMQRIHSKALMCNAKTLRASNAKVEPKIKEVINFTLNYSCKIAVK